MARRLLRQVVTDFSLSSDLIGDISRNYSILYLKPVIKIALCCQDLYMKLRAYRI